MIELKGDFWQVAENPETMWDAICCTTNGIIKNNGELVMGGGIAKDFNEKFKGLAFEWGSRLKEIYDRTDGNLPPVIVSYNETPICSINLVSFPTKIDWHKPSFLGLIENSARQLRTISDALGWHKILLPRPGCGLGGLDWKSVKNSIEHYLGDDRFYIIDKN